MSDVTTLLGIVLGDIIPFPAPPVIRSMMGATIVNMVRNYFHRPPRTVKSVYNAILRLWPTKESVLYIQRTHENPLFSQVESYFFRRFKKEIKSALVSIRHGGIELQLGNDLVNLSMQEEFRGHLVFLEPDIIEWKDEGCSSIRNVIKIASRTASLEDLKSFVSYLCAYRFEDNCIDMYLCVTEQVRERKKNKDGKDRSKFIGARWEHSKIRTNKTFETLFLDPKTEKEIIDDIRWFLSSEDEYRRRGIPWQRGYLICSPPGCGKSSLIKAIANQRIIQCLFTMDLHSICTAENANDVLPRLFGEMQGLSNCRPYVLAIEDADKSLFFEKKQNERGFVLDDRKTGKNYLNLGTLLNSLDGVVESYGRVLIITCNDVSAFKEKKMEALLRPGRIDKTVEMGYLTYPQALAMVRHFFANPEFQFPEHITAETFERGKWTPCFMVDLLQKTLPEEWIQTITSDQQSLSIMMDAENVKSLEEDDKLQNVGRFPNRRRKMSTKQKLRRVQGHIRSHQRSVEQKTKQVETLQKKLERENEKKQREKENKKAKEKKRVKKKMKPKRTIRKIRRIDSVPISLPSSVSRYGRVRKTLSYLPASDL